LYSVLKESESNILFSNLFEIDGIKKIDESFKPFLHCENIVIRIRSPKNYRLKSDTILFRINKTLKN